MTANILASQSNDPSFENLYQELVWRGLIHVSTDAESLEKAIADGGLTLYCGFDPTAPSLHLGHLVALLTVRRLQLGGHYPLALVGGSTGLIGDPRMTSERVLNSKETVASWVGDLQEQIRPILDFNGDHAARMVNNLDWTAPLSAIDFLREIGKHFRVGTMIKKEIVASRLNSEEGISYAEFSYQILQGLDYLELYRQYGCTLQLGGSDQWGNLTSGTELIRKVEGKAVHALGTPLITDSSGKKLGKSEGNAIWLNPTMTSPFEFYQYWLNVADADVIDRLKVFTFFTRDEIADFEEAVAQRPHAREAQRALAFAVTSLVHGDAAALGVIEASKALYGNGDLTALDEPTLVGATAQLENVSAPASGLGVVELFVASGLSKSNSEARRTIGEGGAYVNNVKVTDPDAVIDTTELLHGKYALLRRGKRNLAAVTVAED